MYELLSALMAAVLGLALTNAMAQSLDTRAQKSSDVYKMAKDPCKSLSDAGMQQCARELKVAEESSRLRCGPLTDQAKRQCVLEAFVQQHDRIISGPRVENSEGAPLTGTQPK